MGFASTKREARQMVSHKHILVNGKVVSSPSYKVKEGEDISVIESAKTHNRVQMALSVAREAPQKEWVECDYEKVTGVYKQHPSLEQVRLFDSHTLGMVIVYYSK